MTTIAEDKGDAEKGWQDPRFSRAVLDALPAHVAVLNGAGVIVAVNRSWRRFADENDRLKSIGVGVNYLDVARQATCPFSDEAHSAYRGILSVLDGSVLQFSLEYSCHSPTKPCWLQMEVTLVEGIEPSTAVVMHHDVTGRRLAEEKVRRSELQYRSLAHATAAIVWTCASHAGTPSVLSAWEAFAGLAPGQMTGEGWIQAVHPDDRDLTTARWREAVVKQEPYEDCFRMRRADGQYRFMVARGIPVRDEHGRIQEWVGVCEDITERKEAEDALRANEQRLRLALEAASMGSWVWDIQTNLTIWNDHEYELLGLQPGNEPLETKVFFQHVHPDDLPELQRILSECVDHGTEYKHQFRIVRADGETRWLAARGQVFRDERTGQPQQMFGVNFDITQSKVAEERLRQSESLLRLVLDANPNKIHVKDRDSRLLIANQAVADFYNLPLTDIVGQRQSELHRWLGGKVDELEKWLADDRRVIDTKTAIETIEEGTDFKGEIRTYRTKKMPIQLAGEETAVLAVSEDITDLFRMLESVQRNELRLHLLTSQLESRLRQMEAVAGLGTFAFKTTQLDAVLNKSVEVVSQVLGNEFAKVLELQSDGQSLFLRAGVGWKEGLVGRASVPATGVSQAGYTLLTDEPVIVADLSTETRFIGPQLLFDHGIVSGMSVVIVGEKKPYGVLGTHTTQRRNYSEDDVFFLQSVANILADFIERHSIERRHHLLVQCVQDYAIIMLDPTGNITTWNNGAERITGYRAEEVLGQSVSKFYLPEDVATGNPLRELEQAAQEGRVLHEGWRLCKGGSRIVAECITFVLRDDSGTLLGFSRVLRDTTIQRREEGALRAAIAHTVDAIFTIDPQGIIKSCGGAAERMFGYLASEIVGKNIDLLMPEPVRSEHDGYISNYMRTGVAKIIGSLREVTGLRKDGSTLPLELAITEFRIDGGRFFTGILRDTTIRKNAEAELRQQMVAAQLAAVRLTAVHDAIIVLTEAASPSEAIPRILESICAKLGWVVGGFWSVDQEAGVLRCVTIWKGLPQQKFEEMSRQTTFAPGVGLPGRVWATKTACWVPDLTTDSNFPRIDAALQDGLRSGMGLPIQHSGQILGVLEFYTSEATQEDHALLQVLESIGGQIGQFIVRKSAEETLAASKLRLQHVVASSPAILYTLSVQGNTLRPTWMSDNLPQMMGYCSIDFLDPNWWLGNVHPEDLLGVLATTKSDLFAHGQMINEYRFRHRDGSYRWIRNETRLLQDDAGETYEAIGSWFDITERRVLEQQLRQSQKMDAVGQLAGGIAHDFNNLLTIITGYSEMVMSDLPASDPHKEFITEIVQAGNRAVTLTSQLLAFSRKQVLTPRVLNLNDVVENCEKMLRRLIGEDVVLTTAYDPSLLSVKVDPGQMEQVIVNLAINARDAMLQGGMITLETHTLVLDGEQCKPYPGCKPGAYAALDITDTGCGMTPDVMSRIFEPFYTTKGLGKGTGLGLATVYGIVKQSEGYIAVDSTVGVGTTFKVWLPAIPEVPDSSRPNGNKTVIRGGNETVLLVEDEEGVRKLARRMLEKYGYKVLVAHNGQEATKLEATHDGPIHLLITDVVMPEMSGRQVVDIILPRRQGLKVLYISGYTDDTIVRHGISDATNAFLQKPFSPQALAMKVREVLDGES